jgi:hypothetical protein
MKETRTPLHIALLPYLLGDDEPLVGDLVEEWPRRSHAWFWRQVVFAMLATARATASAALREPQRLTGALGASAIFLILSFQVVVAGSLLDDLIRRIDRTQMTRIDHPEWLLFFVLLSLPVAWFIGRAIGRLHHRSRAATVAIAGASAAVVGAVTVSVLSATDSFFPSAARQTAAGMVFVLGLLIGSSSRSPLDRQA